MNDYPYGYLGLINTLGDRIYIMYKVVLIGVKVVCSSLFDLI